MKRLQSGSDFSMHALPQAAVFSSNRVLVVAQTLKMPLLKPYSTILTSSFTCGLFDGLSSSAAPPSFSHGAEKLQHGSQQRCCMRACRCWPVYNHIFTSHDFCNAGDNLRASSSSSLQCSSPSGGQKNLELVSYIIHCAALWGGKEHRRDCKGQRSSGGRPIFSPLKHMLVRASSGYSRTEGDGTGIIVKCSQAEMNTNMTCMHTKGRRQDLSAD